MQGAQKILEIGTLAAYSTIWLARAVPSGGRVMTLEANPKYAEAAIKNIAVLAVTFTPLPIWRR